MTTPLREYVLLDSKSRSERYWYGYYEGNTCYWSGWHNTIAECVNAQLEYLSSNETADEYQNIVAHHSWEFIYRSPVPFDPSEHPEYFI